MSSPKQDLTNLGTGYGTLANTNTANPYTNLINQIYQKNYEYVFEFKSNEQNIQIETNEQNNNNNNNNNKNNNVSPIDKIVNEILTKREVEMLKYFEAEYKKPTSINKSNYFLSSRISTMMVMGRSGLLGRLWSWFLYTLNMLSSIIDLICEVTELTKCIICCKFNCCFISSSFKPMR